MFCPEEIFYYKIIIQYDGKGLLGWQSHNDDNLLTVESYIIDALFCLFGEKIKVQGAGRTDSGVHALKQVANFSCRKYFPCDVICRALNFHLKTKKVAIIGCEEVDKSFNARFSAKSRTYVYRIMNSGFYLPVHRNFCWFIRDKIDLDRMAEGAKFFIGHHDFSAFRKSGCQAKSPIKTVDVVDVAKVESFLGDEINITVKAGSFLYSQVRIMVGTLVDVGLGKIEPADVKKILDSKDRSSGGDTSPPQGLFLVDVEY